MIKLDRLSSQGNIGEPTNHGVHLKPAVETIAKFCEITGQMFTA